MNHAKSFDLKKALALVLCVLIYVVLVMLPTPQGLTIEGQRAIALMIVSVIIWSTEMVPVTISSILLPMTVGILGIAPVGEVLKNFTTSTILFMCAVQLIASAFAGCGVGKRVSLAISFLFGNKPKMVLLSFMLFTALISMFLVDIPTAIIFSGIAYEVLKKNGCQPGSSNFGKAVMIGIPIASALGGFGTPVGSGLNILTINLLEMNTGIRINFFQWTAIGVPVAVILVFAAWLIITKLFPAEIDIVKGSEDIKKERAELGPLSTDEKKFLTVFLITCAFWVTQPLTGLDNTLVACVSAFVLAFTGINLIKWETARNAVGWEGLFLVGGATAVAMTLVITGASGWIAGLLTSSLMGMAVALVIVVIVAFGILSHLILPVGGAMVSLMVPIVAQVATSIGINPILLVLPIGYTVSCVFLIPLDPIPMSTYNYKYWKMGEMAKAGVPISLVWIVVLSIAMLIVYSLGLI